MLQVIQILLLCFCPKLQCYHVYATFKDLVSNRVGHMLMFWICCLPYCTLCFLISKEVSILQSNILTESFLFLFL